MIRGLVFSLSVLFWVDASAQTPLRVKMFPGAQALPVSAAVSQGIFQRHGLKVEQLFTANSVELRDGLASGDFQIAQSAVDNAVAMVEVAKHDIVIVTGGDSSMNELFVQPDVRSLADLKGQTVVVDAPNTAYALQLRKIALRAELEGGWGGKPPAPERYIDLSYYERALRLVGH